jgi:hypothetical protein
MSKRLILIGAVLIVLGLLWPYLQKLHLGRLPGDISLRREGFSFYFPITTCLLISIILTKIYWIYKK